MALFVDNKLLSKLPQYAQAWKWIELERSAWGGSFIDAICEPIEGDPEQEEQVSFTCDNFEEFLWRVRQYKKNFRREP